MSEEKTKIYMKVKDVLTFRNVHNRTYTLLYLVCNAITMHGLSISNSSILLPNVNSMSLRCMVYLSVIRLYCSRMLIQ